VPTPPPLSDLILRGRAAASRRMNGTSRATWFETARSLSSGRAMRGPGGASSPWGS